MDPEVLAFYSRDYREDDRLRMRAHGVLERARTQELLTRLLPPAPASVLDVGGGTGIHAEWLVERGYEVHLVDPVPDHVATAETIAGVTAEVGDIRSLRQDDASFDAVVALGPLYHLPRAADRRRAIGEARRVARGGAPVVFAAISRYATLMDIGSDGRLTAELELFVQELHETGQFRGGFVGFTTAYFHLPDELRRELTSAGLDRVEVYGIEGPAGPAIRALGLDALPERLDAAVLAARLVERDPLMLAASGHLLGVGYA